MAVTLGMTAWCPMMAGRKEQVIVVKNKDSKIMPVAVVTTVILNELFSKILSLNLDRWLTAFLHPVIFPCVLHTAKEIEKWWDKKRVLWHVEQLRKIEEKYKE